MKAFCIISQQKASTYATQYSGRFVARIWPVPTEGPLLDVPQFLAVPMAYPLLGALLGIAIAGGMFVVPLYAFLTTRVAPHKASRTIAANNIVNSGAMVAGSLVAMAMSAIGIPITEQVLLCAAMCLVSAWLGKRLVAAENEACQVCPIEQGFRRRSAFQATLELRDARPRDRSCVSHGTR